MVTRSCLSVCPELTTSSELFSCRTWTLTASINVDKKSIIIMWHHLCWLPDFWFWTNSVQQEDEAHITFNWGSSCRAVKFQKQSSLRRRFKFQVYPLPKFSKLIEFIRTDMIWQLLQMQVSSGGVISLQHLFELIYHITCLSWRTNRSVITEEGWSRTTAGLDILPNEGCWMKLNFFWVCLKNKAPPGLMICQQVRTDMGRWEGFL